MVAIVGILTADAPPNFLAARTATKIGCRVGEAIALAKECAVYLSTDIGTPFNAGTYRTGSATDKVLETCDPSGNGSFVATWGTVTATGVNPLTMSTMTASTAAAITVFRGIVTGVTIACVYCPRFCGFWLGIACIAPVSTYSLPDQVSSTSFLVVLLANPLGA